MSSLQDKVMEIDKKIAVVTGGNRGLGLETCRQLAQQGVQVILTSRDPSKGKETVKKLEEEGLSLDYHQCDVTLPESVKKLAGFVEQKYNRCDILVNNAGIFIDKASFQETPLETVTKTMETNVYGPLLLCQALIPLMKKRGYGRIVNLSSGLGQLTHMGADYPSYSMSKTAINTITRILAAELQGSNIKINSACPGWVRTDMGGPNADRSVEEGVKTTLWLATLPDSGPSGKFFRDKKEIPW